MRIPLWTLLVGVAAGVALVLLVGFTLIDPNTPLIQSAGFEVETITPNADGDTDIALFSYSLSRPARVSLVFTNEAGDTFTFRDSQERAAGGHSVLFSGVVDGYSEAEGVEIERQLIPDGTYTWTLVAEGLQREEQTTETGTLIVREGDSTLPMINSFAMTTNRFTPNQDGISDRVNISVSVPKEAEVTAALLDEDGTRYVIPSRVDVSEDDEGFRHEFDYEGGVDTNADPPADGTYQVVVSAQDLVGQRVSRTAELTIEKGGKPYAQIVGQAVEPDVVFITQPYEERFYSDAEGLGDLIEPPEDGIDQNFNVIPIELGDMLVFKLVVENYGASPIRTSGPPPGTVYQQTQLFSSLGREGFQQAGVWRVGIQCETSSESYPYRWALGDESTLEAEYDEATGNTYLYLPPGGRAVVWGAVRMTEYVRTLNPQGCYAGLIHEGVNVINLGVGTRSIQLENPVATHEFNVTPSIEGD
jgi:hypothetical protein